MYKRGAVIGKFYPFHLGHKYLIDTALLQSEKLYIMVCFRQDESIPAEVRYDWLKSTYPTAEVLLVEDEDYEQDNSRVWADLTKMWLGFTPDAVFTSESYGETWAKELGCEHVVVDEARGRVPVSGTKIRNNPYKYWDYMLPKVRQYFVKRACLVGAESTGKSTLAKELAEHYQTVWVPEYGRMHWESRLTMGKSFEWREEDFLKIVEEQNRNEDELALEANKVLICDTDNFATSIWFERYMGYRSWLIGEAAKNREYDLYILPDVNTPFEDDGTRDGEHLRGWMHARFVDELERAGKKYIEVKGNREERLKQATQEIDKLFKNKTKGAKIT